MPKFASVAVIALMLLARPGSASEWREAEPMPEPRWFHRAAVGNDGKIYAYGGYTYPVGADMRRYGVDERALVIYEPQFGAWVRGPAAPKYQMVKRFYAGYGRGQQMTYTPRERPQPMALAHEAPYGAADAAGRILWFTFPGWMLFDPAAGDWAQIPGPIRLQPRPRSIRSADESDGWGWEGPVPELRRKNGATATGPDGRIYLIGGVGHPSQEPDPRKTWELLADVTAYDPATKEWTVLPSLRHPRQISAAAFGRDGRLYVFGGYAHTGHVHSGPEVTEAEHDKRVAEMRYRGRHPLESVEIYDPRTNAWSSGAPMPVPIQSADAALAADGRIYVVGGARRFSNPRAERVVQIYDPARDRWSLGPELRTARQGHAVVSTPDGRLYAIGGTNAHSVPSLVILIGGESGRRGGPLASVEMLRVKKRAQ